MTEVLALPPLPAVGTCHVEIFGPDSGAAKWDEALWDEDVWAGLGWRDVTPESVNVEMAWGADDPSGVLTVPAAGSWTITTYDPERKLDPSNGASPYLASLRPGRPIRITHIDPVTLAVRVVRTGLIDSVKFNLKDLTGALTGTDGISLMAGAKLPPDQHLDVKMPKTLRARARYLLEKAGLTNLISVEGGEDFHAVAQETNPISYWRFNEKLITTPAINEGSSGISGTYTGNVTLNEPGLTLGSDNSMRVSGGGHMQSDSNEASLAGVNWSASAWVRIDALPASPAAILARGNNRPWIAILPSGVIGTGKGGSATVTAQGTVPLTLGVSHHIAVTHGDDGYIIYVDGIDCTAVRGLTNTFATSLARTSIGTYEGGSTLNPFDGWIDSPMLHNYTLSVDTIKTLYDYGIGIIGSYDPPVGPMVENEASVWSHIMNAAYDALYAIWMDRLAILRFRSFGNPKDNGFAVGGADGIPIENIDVESGLANVFTRIVAYDETAPESPVIAFDETKSAIYGDIILRRQSPVPEAQKWADSVLADRSGAALQYLPGTMYPQTVENLYDILDLGMIDIMHVRADSVSPTIDVATRVLGGKIIADTGTGWTVTVSSYIPASEWDESETLPPEPPIVIPPGTQTQIVSRDYNCNKSTAVARSSGGNYYGAGKDTELPIGAWQGWRYRTFLDFDDIPWNNVVEVQKCELVMNVTTQVQVGFGSSPKVVIKRVTESWPEGGASGQQYNNGTIYPGPKCTSTGSVSRSVTRTENQGQLLAMTEICRAWFNGSKQYGIGVFSAGEDNTKYTTEWWPHENSTADRRPKLRLTLKVIV
jgi:hypothetical protein